jgi:hypothetical protein
MNRHQPQPGGKTRLGECLQRVALVITKGLRRAKQDTYHTILASRTANRAVVAIDDDHAGSSRSFWMQASDTH